MTMSLNQQAIRFFQHTNLDELFKAINVFIKENDVDKVKWNVPYHGKTCTYYYVSITYIKE